MGVSCDAQRVSCSIQSPGSGCLALLRASLMLRALLRGSCDAQGMLRALCQGVLHCSGHPFPQHSFPQGVPFWNRGSGDLPWLGAAGAGTRSCAGGRACGTAGARCFPDITHFLSGFSAFSFLCTCLFWTTNKIKRVFITLFPWGCEFRI